MNEKKSTEHTRVKPNFAKQGDPVFWGGSLIAKPILYHALPRACLCHRLPRRCRSTSKSKVIKRNATYAETIFDIAKIIDTLSRASAALMMSIDLTKNNLPLSANPPNWLNALVKAEALPTRFGDVAIDHYLPLAQAIAAWSTEHDAPLVVGVNGAQGTGKSTLSKVLALALERDHDLCCAILSIDDMYRTRQERQQLAETVHPLLVTRGVPGTHDVAMGIDLIETLKRRQPVQLPQFDKAIDDRAPKAQWVACNTPVDVILFEGWCVGARPQPAESLTEPCNELEASEDRDAAWRTHTNHQLADSYTELFALIDRLVMLKAPDFECVYEWRRIQEEKLRERHATEPSSEKNAGHAIMNDAQINRFIMHYERLTRWMLAEMPQRADVVMELNQQHGIDQTRYARSGPTE